MKATKRDYDKLGPWSIDKLEILTKYLRAYTLIMSKQAHWCTGYDYIDAFAGPAAAWSKTDKELISTSPRIAVETEPSFSAFYFVELDEKRYENLLQVKNEHREKQISCIRADANEALQKKIIPVIANDKWRRAFAFIDPWAMDFEWETIEAISQSGNIEMLVNFPIMAILRGVLWRNFSEVPQSSRDKLTRLWGSEDWIKDWYKRSETLFGETVQVRKYRDALSFGDLFKKRIESVFKFTTEPLLMRNSLNAPIYTLQFAGPNDTGKRIMSDITRKYKREH